MALFTTFSGLKPFDEACDQLQRLLSGILVRGMTTVFQYDTLQWRADVPVDNVQLLHRRVLVIAPLDDKQWLGDRRQLIREVDEREVGVQPTITPAVKRPLSIFTMMMDQSLFQRSFNPAGGGVPDRFKCLLFQDHVRSKGNAASYSGIIGRSEGEGYGRAVAVTQQHNVVQSKCTKDFPQLAGPCLSQIVKSARQGDRGGRPVSSSAIDHNRAPCRIPHLLGKVAPLGCAPQAFMQKHKCQMWLVSARQVAMFDVTIVKLQKN